TLEVVHVDERGGATLDHLETGQPSPRAYELLVHVLGLGGEDRLLEPLLERGVVGEASKEDHRRVRVRVDEAPDYGSSRGVDRAPRPGLAGGGLGGPRRPGGGAAGRRGAPPR